mmetsp:Transcript_12566/g.20149  ORF Transcript_12566/g.20149 Transcript_12566/m.20149 type:complete len:121 (+) Transcript_12566:626-988(+)
MVDAVLERIGDGDEKEAVFCTLYSPCFDHDLPWVQRLVLIDSKGFIAALVNRCATAFHTMLMRLIVAIGVRMLNRTIMRILRERDAGLPVLNLHAIFDNKADYENPIEPSARGGDKISVV